MPARRRGGKRADESSGTEPLTSPQKQSKTSSSSLHNMLKRREELRDGLFPFIATILMGLVFGFALNKGRVAEPIVITDQFKFVRWTMMKMFLAAAATSSLSLSVLAALFKEHFAYARSKYAGCNNLSGTIIGGLILGCGMAVGGACPGMVLIQVGAGVPNSLITLLGALSGAFFYGLTEPFFRSFFSSNDLKKNVFLDEIFGINFSILAFIFGSLIMLFALFLESMFPWENELLKANIRNCTFLECRSWSPIISGILVGILQIPCLLILGNTLGGASSYVAVTGQWLRLMPEGVANYFSHFQGQLNRFWQVLYVCSAIGGSMIAVYVGGGNVLNLLNEPFDDIKGSSVNKAFLGGFLMLFGARLAKGCTSGHGLSGMGLLNVASMIAVAAMFGGGGVVGLVLEHVLKF